MPKPASGITNFFIDNLILVDKTVFDNRPKNFKTVLPVYFFSFLIAARVIVNRDINGFIALFQNLADQFIIKIKIVGAHRNLAYEFFGDRKSTRLNSSHSQI